MKDINAMVSGNIPSIAAESFNLFLNEIINCTIARGMKRKFKKPMTIFKVGASSRKVTPYKLIRLPKTDKMLLTIKYIKEETYKGFFHWFTFKYFTGTDYSFLVGAERLREAQRNYD